MNQTQTNKPQKINTDKARKYLDASEAAYLLNHDVLNPSSIGKSVPLPANTPLCEIEQPEGENFSIGTYNSTLTNETYSWVYNTNGVNYISRINGDGSCQIVYSGDCLPLSADPAHGIFQWRALMRLEKICHNRHGKELVFVDGTDNDIFCIDTEASIATNNFTTPFFERCADDCAPLKLCVPDICGCVKGEFAALENGQEMLTNHLIDVGVKIIVRHIYYDLRASEWSVPSTLFYQDIKGGCFGGATGFSRCLKLTVPLGNPLVDKIEIGYSTDNGATWLLSDTVEKYSSYTSANQFWYERDINPELDLTEDGCSFYYFFCNDKQCQPIDPAEVSRVYNPLPREPQGLIEIKDSYGFYNYKQGTCPIDKVETDKFEVALNCDNAADCVTEYVTVKVRAIVHQSYTQMNQFVFRSGGTLYNDVDDKTDEAKFGGVGLFGGVQTFGQTFAGGARNFKPYIEGTSYSAEMKQWKAFNGFTLQSEVGVISGVSHDSTTFKLYGIIGSGFFYYQEAVFTVPKGMKGFIRLPSHTAPNDRSTSTYVRGTIDDIRAYVSHDAPLPTVNQEFEIYFDTCNGDVDLDKTFIITDNEEQAASRAFNGYVIDAQGAPLAGVELWTSDNFFLCTTDFNGFYHFTLREATSPQPVEVRMEKACDDYGVVQSINLSSVAGQSVSKDIQVTDMEYATKWYAWASVRVIDCDGNNIAGVPVAVSGAKYRYTGDDGTALIPIRNNATRNRKVRAIAMDAGGCFLLDCNGNCNPCVASEVKTAPACFDVTHFVPKSIDFAPIVLNIQQKSLTNRGLKKSGRYGFGIVAMGDCGRISSVYELKNGYLNIPRFQENSSEDFCSFTYRANLINLPSWVKCLQIVRTENLNPFELQWVVDKIERTGDGKIILTIQGLNDYNERYFFKTNTVYQYQQGDRIEFISNGDGKVFSFADHGILNYATLSPFNDGTTENTDADFFNQLIIQDDGKLNELVEGAKIEIQRQKTCTTDPVYYSICQSLEVENGQVVVQTGTFETFDTFRVTRQIGSFSPQSFEHFAPSDFWITKANDLGKAYFVNKYENERRYGRNISLNSPNQFNRFGDTVKTIPSPGQGDIIALSISDGRAVLGICENDSFVLSVADDLVRVSADGAIVAVPADRIIGDPQVQLGGQFGCRYQDAGSILFDEGYALWADVKRDAYVKHDYSKAVDVSLNKFKTYLKNKFREIQINNASVNDDLLKFRFVTGINRFNGAAMLTMKSLKDSNINNAKKELSLPNETIIFHAGYEDLLTFLSFTPESYANINLNDEEGCAFICYDKGTPFLHPIVATKWNEFFGVAVDRVMTIAINKFPEKIKVAVSLEVQDETMWYVHSVTCDKPNYLSEIFPKKFTKTENKWSASFLGNKNSRKGIHGNEQPRGYWVEITLIKDNTVDLQINSVNSAKQIAYDELDQITSKFFLSEQSGFTGNL